MKLRILGTAAAEAWPAIFCGCPTCRRARQAGGNNLRSRASVQIDDVHKIDLPPDTYYHTIRFGLDLASLKHLFITHSHEDHFDTDELNYIKPPFAHDLTNAPIRIYGNERVIGAIGERFDGSELVEPHLLEPFATVRADHLRYTPIIAQHAPHETALNYIIQSDADTVLYASDTGLYDEVTMEHLAGYRFDLMIIECTQGTLEMPSRYHMGLNGVRELRKRLVGLGSARPDTRLVITHFSHNMGLLHDELAAIAEPEGIEVAYDGIELEC